MEPKQSFDYKAIERANTEDGSESRLLRLETHSSEESRARDTEEDNFSATGDRRYDWSSAFEEVTTFPSRAKQYFVRLSNAFSFRFVLLVMIVYGMNQGVGEGWSSISTTFFFSSPPSDGGLGIEEERAQKVLGFANIPWQVKSIYGIFSDLFPIYGFHRTNYIVIAGILGCIAWFQLCTLPLSILNATMVGVLLFLGNLSIASPDVMIDASVAERCRTHPQFAADLQTLCWGSFGVGQVLSYATGGVLYETIGSRGLFAMTFFTAVVMMVPAYRGWLKETRSEKPEDQGLCTFRVNRLRSAFEDEQHGPIISLSLAFLGCSFILGGLAEANLETEFFVFVAMATTVVVSCLIYYFESPLSPLLAKATLFILLSGAIQPSSDITMTYWFRDTYPECKEEGYTDTPCFSPSFITNISVVGYICFIVGTAIYNRYFSLWSYQRIYTVTQLMVAIASFLDVILVNRWNLYLGIPDQFFVLGDEIIGTVVSRLNTMPLFVLAASICPPGIEATLFAFNMGISNFGNTLGSYMGLGLLDALGTKHPEFENLGLFVLIRTLFRFAPLLLIPILLPKGTPEEVSAEILTTNTKGDTELVSLGMNEVRVDNGSSKIQMVAS